MSENVNWYRVKLTDGMMKPQYGNAFVAGTDETHATKVAEAYYPDAWMNDVTKINECDGGREEIEELVRSLSHPNLLIDADGTVVRRSALEE